MSGFSAKIDVTWRPAFERLIHETAARWAHLLIKGLQHPRGWGCRFEAELESPAFPQQQRIHCSR